MRAHPGTACRDVAQQRVERCASFPVLQRIDPYQHTVHRQKLIANLVRKFLVENCRLGVKTNRGEFLEHATKAIVLWRRRASSLAITAPDHRHSRHSRCHRASLILIFQRCKARPHLPRAVFSSAATFT